MSSEHAEVRGVLATLAQLIRSSDAPLDAFAVAVSLSSLKTKSCDHPEVRDLISALVPRILLCHEEFDSWKLST
eukprot:gene47113-60942_t